MPFTPFHMGPGILVKSLLQGGFSLMVFGWSQIVMDLQPLVAIITGKGELHGFTHTYIGSTFVAIFSAITGKYLSQWALVILSNGAQRGIEIRWRIAFLSAFIGAYSHVLLDSIMHADVMPLAPFIHVNDLLGLVSIDLLHKLCVYSGVVGAAMYFTVSYMMTRHRNMFYGTRRRPG